MSANQSMSTPMSWSFTLSDPSYNYPTRVLVVIRAKLLVFTPINVLLITTTSAIKMLQGLSSSHLIDIKAQTTTFGYQILKIAGRRCSLTYDNNMYHLGE